ncbi:MAG TPA: translation elongation factor Ts [Geminicoccus sp.]|jgi:elongation factor Ts|uniref:translation elongation factor Ts n=1 Tax=Geminicoccus sp. TaxID=2024832 RepID=UPI002E37130D|nr:translation elongation factor Ts [Geminicoccus sp.]HEX2527665.1 translation elongation factor Ts [Geminicoccus sp.]
MAQITSALVKQLREQTGAGMMDCKKALEATDGNLEEAVDWLRKKGLAAAAKKSGRTAAEGLVGLKLADTAGALVEINAETDFVSRNEQFQAIVMDAAALAIDAMGDVEKLKGLTVPSSGRTVADEITNGIAVIGENMSLRRTAMISVADGVVAGYMHGQLAPNLGKIGVLVGLQSTGDKAKLAEIGKQIAMHVAATNPQSVSTDNLDPALIARERAIFADQAAASGKPANIIEKMVDGRIRKFYEEVVLLEQVFVVNPDQRVKDVIAQAAKDVGAPVTLTAFVRMQCGEGIQKEADDLAAEVAKLAGV